MSLMAVANNNTPTIRPNNSRGSDPDRRPPNHAPNNTAGTQERKLVELPGVDQSLPPQHQPKRSRLHRKCGQHLRPTELIVKESAHEHDNWGPTGNQRSRP